MQKNVSRFLQKSADFGLSSQNSALRSAVESESDAHVG